MLFIRDGAFRVSLSCFPVFLIENELRRLSDSGLGAGLFNLENMKSGMEKWPSMVERIDRL